MTTCLNYMQHMMKLSKSRKKPKQLNTCRSHAMEYKGKRGGGGFMLDCLTSAGV